MKRISFLLVLLCLVLSAFSQEVKYKCLLQMSNYQGEGAYIAASIISPSGEYVKTMNVRGEDDKWYDSLLEWHKFQSKAAEDIDGITGASITSGNRSVFVLSIDDSQLDAGYKLRFETAVENEKYHKEDVEIALTTENLKKVTEGTGYIRFVRFNKA